MNIDISHKNRRQRRFESLPTPAPESVIDLPDDHPAIIGNTPLFSDQIYSANDVNNLFISGKNNRKIGSVITKGPWQGMPMYMLTLPERVTCPRECYLYKSCYGNAQHMAKRVAPGANLEQRIRTDIPMLVEKHPRGFVIRLHILGDFYSAAYVRLWGKMLATYPELRIYGYSARGQAAGETLGDRLDQDIAEELRQLKARYPQRFAIRWSRPMAEPGSATVLDKAPDVTPKGGIICPAETNATACCVTCGLCWEPDAQQKTIYFLKHGMGSSQGRALATEQNQKVVDGLRQIRPLPQLKEHASKPIGTPPMLLWVKPTELWVESAYQRDLSKQSIVRISRIIRNFNWALFSPPLCVRVDGKLHCIDGQHGAIAAATHPMVEDVPIICADADRIQDRAMLFIGKNWERLNPTAAQRHTAEITAENPQALEIKRVTDAAGVRVLAVPPLNKKYEVGDTMALGVIRRMLRDYGAEGVTEVLKLLVDTEQAPLRKETIIAMADVLLSEGYRGRVSIDAVASVLRRTDHGDILVRAKAMVADISCPIREAIASVYFQEAVKE